MRTLHMKSCRACCGPLNETPNELSLMCLGLQLGYSKG